VLATTGFAQEVVPLASELLEEGVYQEEAKGDLGAAIALYQQVVESEQASRPRAAEAQYRLAVCYQKQGTATAAVRAFEALIANYPNQTEWVEAAMEHLPKPFEAELVPWVDGEISTMDLRLPNGYVVGHVIRTTELITSDGRELWRMTNRTMANGEMITIVDIDPETQKPVYGYFNGNQPGMGEIRWWFEEDHVRLLMGDDPEEKTVPLSGDVIDNLQAQYLIRQFPIEVGFSTEQTVFVGLTAASTSVRFDLVAIEDVDTPMGTIECAHIEINLEGQVQHFWVANDDSRRSLKFEAGGVGAVATRVDIVSPGEEQLYRNDAFGFEAELPAAWAAFDKSNPEKADRYARIEIRDPDVMNTYSIAATRDSEEEDVSELSDLEEARKMAEKHVNGYKKKTSDFEVDELSWTESETSEGALVSYRGSMEMGALDMNVKKSFLRQNGVTLVFTMRCRVDAFEDSEPAFDEIVASARID